jgi:uncharacterized repeat protein (TIGR01451 family)
MYLAQFAIKTLSRTVLLCMVPLALPAAVLNLWSATSAHAQGADDTCLAPTFALPNWYLTGLKSVESFVAGDLTGDGAPELVTSHAGPSFLNVLVNDGAGHFDSHLSVPLASPWASHLGIVIGDFTSDGRADVAVGRSSPAAIVILPGDGSGGFGTPIAIPLGDGFSINSIIAADDLDLDGRLDVVAMVYAPDFGDWVIGVLAGDGTGAFTGPRSGIAVHTVADPWWRLAGDFNEDGLVDIATIGITSDFSKATVLLADGTGGFTVTPHVDIGPTRFPDSIDAGDFNGDGHLDLAVTGERVPPFPHDAISVLLGDGSGGFAPLRIDSGREVLAAADLNGDGRDDLLLSAADPGILRVLTWTDASGFEPGGAVRFLYDPSLGIVAPVAADFDRDGRIDVAAFDHDSTPSEGPPRMVGIARNICGIPGADLAVTITDTPDPVARDATLSYSVAIENRGPDMATGVRVSNAVPAGVDFLTATITQGSCAPTGPPLGPDRTVACEVGAMAAGAVVTLDIRVTPTVRGTLLDTATVSANEPDPDPINTFTAETHVEEYGGRGFGLTSEPGGVIASWASAPDQSGYQIGAYVIDRVTHATRTFALPSLPADATSSAISLEADPNSIHCFVLVAFDGSYRLLTRSDMLCTIPGYVIGTGAPSDFTIRLNESTSATFSWTAPGGQTGYVLHAYPMNGNPPYQIDLPTDAGAVTDPTGGIVTCYVLVAKSGDDVIGVTNALCAVPGFSSFSPTP